MTATESTTMSRVAITLLAKKMEPTEVDARLHAVGNSVSVILALAWIIERRVDPVARGEAAQLVYASRWLKELAKQYTELVESASGRP
jgi:hypothetical protein